MNADGGAGRTDTDEANIDGTDADEANIDGTDADEATIDGTDADGTAFGDRVVDYWIGLDRGWQALFLGLGVVAVHLMVQVL